MRTALFTLTFPITLPDEHTFFDNGQYPVPPLPGGLSFHSMSFDKAPLFLQIAGFAAEQHAIQFCQTLRIALRVVALDSGHSILPSDAAPIVSAAKHFDGSVPTVTPTSAGAMPYLATASMQNGLHISVLSKLIGASLTQQSPAKVSASPQLSLALELYSGCEFAGERNAQFIVLMSALEVLPPKSSPKGKRGAVIAFVKNELSKVGHPNPKSIGKELDKLYVARNALLHEARSVSDSELRSLKEIVRSTLKALIR